MAENDCDNKNFRERRDEVYLYNSVFGECYCDELKEMDKHEILVKICEVMGSNPCNFGLAEQILENLKFDIARYVLHHEYCRYNGIRSKLLLWLDSKINPDNARKLSTFIDKYLNT